MSTYLDIETDRFHDEEDGGDYVEWTTVKLCPWGSSVHIKRELASPRYERHVDPEAGISLHTKHLDALIDSLVRLRADLGMQPAQHDGEKNR